MGVGDGEGQEEKGERGLRGPGMSQTDTIRVDSQHCE